jgi:hypothetical protein
MWRTSRNIRLMRGGRTDPRLFPMLKKLFGTAATNNARLSNPARLRCPVLARMSSPLRASNEGLLRPRVARAQGTHRAISLCWRTFRHPGRLHPNDRTGNMSPSPVTVSLIYRSSAGPDYRPRQTAFPSHGNRATADNLISTIHVAMGHLLGPSHHSEYLVGMREADFDISANPLT